MKINIATNNGDIGGGEVMLLNIARAIRQLGHDITVVGPATPVELVQAAQDEGFKTVILPAKNRADYMFQLRNWNSKQNEILWCNGLVPSVATSGQKNRIVHLHQIPAGPHKLLASVSKKKALRVLVPSNFASSLVSGSQVFYNWVSPVPLTQTLRTEPKLVRVGFLGRPSDFKGTQYVARAIYTLNRSQNIFHFKLVIGGESRFVPENEKRELISALSEINDDLVELGWTTPENYFSQIDIATVPSNWDEVFGLVVAETMSVGKPLIVSDAGALPEVVGHDYPYIFEQANSEMLADMILKIAQQINEKSSVLEDTINKSSWRWQEEYSPEAGKNRVEQLINSLN